MKKRTKKKGFTLIELIVVIAILGILAAVAVPRLTGFQNSARISADKATFDTITKTISIAVADGKITADTIVLSTISGKVAFASTTAANATYITGMFETAPVFKLTSNSTLVGINWVVDANAAVTTVPKCDATTGAVTN